MPDLVALAVPAGPHFVDALSRIWSQDDAAMPVDLSQPAPTVQRILAAMKPAAIVDQGGRHSLHKVAAKAGWTPEPVERGDALVMTTSGTTGTPKGVVLTHDALAAHADAVHAHLNVDPQTDSWLACLPLTHMGGLGVVLRAVHSQVPLKVHYGFKAERVERAAREGATLVSLVSTAMRRIDPALFRVIVLGGAAVPPDRPANSVATYGLTETGGGVVYDGHPLDGVEMRTSSDGEIELKCPMLFRAYRDGRSPISADGWFPTGDLGAIADDGPGGPKLSVSGRRGDMIITGGENVWPAPIEAILAAHPAVSGAVVVGRPDPEWGSAVSAIIEVTATAAAPTLDELRGLVKDQLPASHAPKALEVVDSLPRTALGKIRRAEVR